MEYIHKTLSFFRGKEPGDKECFLAKLPIDVFLDNILVYLDTEELIRIRRVNKFFLQVTEHPSLWKGLLRRTRFKLPPVPPTSRYSIEEMSGLEAERLLTRAISLDKTWGQPLPEPLETWKAHTYYHINSMFLVPGGRYLVASVRDASEAHMIAVYVLDHPYRALPIATMPTKAKAYHLQAKYLNIPDAPTQYEYDHPEDVTWKPKTIPSLVISYLCSRPKSSKDGQTLFHEYNAGYDMDIDVPIVHECHCMHVSLDHLEILGHHAIDPGSQEFKSAALRQGAPFRQLIYMRSKSNFGPTNLSEVYGVPYFVVTKLPNTIVFRQLVPRTGSVELRCLPLVDRHHSIMTIRMLPDQHQILVVRRIGSNSGTEDQPITVFELYDIPINLSGDTVVEERTPVHVDGTPSLLVDAQIPEPDIPLRDDLSYRKDHSLGMYHGGPLNAYCRQIEPNAMFRVSFKPLPGDREPRDPIRGRLPLRTRYSPSEVEEHEAIGADEGTSGHFLAGSRRSLLFYTSVDDIGLCPKVIYLDLYSVPGQLRTPPEMHHSSPSDLQKRRPMLDLYNRIAAMAWDETIGRLCMVEEDHMVLHVLEYARAPRIDPEGRRYPLCLPLLPKPEVLDACAAIPDDIVEVKEEETEVDVDIDRRQPYRVTVQLSRGPRDDTEERTLVGSGLGLSVGEVIFDSRTPDGQRDTPLSLTMYEADV
ncbi:hypothetical protein EUX98_g1947 [Antrodiella citrinella]|uniref:F-box domain-containing protein n=1 Tax=Antrodiella citrinella TaxID=2447956 RepID=A0A4S4N068_9APHY|nr:hypothetical protein EUX98_g1947 [Antrodiella citrinella]